MVVDWMSTELLINGHLAMQVLFNGPKIATPVMKPGGIALFFSLSVNDRYGTEMKILPTFCQYNRVK